MNDADRARKAKETRLNTMKEEMEAMERLLKEKPLDEYSAEESAIALGLELMQSKSPQTRLRGRCLRDVIGPFTNILTDAYSGDDFERTDEFVEPLMGIIAHMLLMVVGPLAADREEAIEAGANYLAELAKDRMRDVQSK